MVNGLVIAFPCTIAAVDADTFLKIRGKLLENVEKHTVFLAETKVGIFDFLGRDERFMVADFLIVFADLCPDIIQVAVDAVGLDAATFSATAAHFPKVLRDTEFGTELGDTPVDRNTAHDGDGRLLFVFVPFSGRTEP